eukprot:PhF_6_TR41130/c1_g1_i1/m.62296
MFRSWLRYCTPTCCWNVALSNLTGSSTTYQEDRMPSPDLVIYDTNQRRKIRAELLRMAMRSHQTGTYLTGVGGNGKSHNLALFAQHAKALGHAVVYINTLKAWLRHANLLPIVTWVSVWFKQLRRKVF